jgi:hypothetical protein
LNEALSVTTTTGHGRTGNSSGNIFMLTLGMFRPRARNASSTIW